VVRQWTDGTPAPSPALIRAVDRLADLPAHIAGRLASEISGIWIGPGAVPDLDDLGHLRGVPVRPDRPRIIWDLIAGMFTDGLIAVGSIGSDSHDVMLHEVGHAMDRMDRMSDGDEFTALHALVRPVLASSVYRDRPAELFAEGFALTVADYPAGLVTMMNGNEHRAEVVWAYFRRHYLIGRHS